MANDLSLKNDEPVELSIIMPCLNEAKTIGICIKKAQGFLQNHGIKGEIVIGDNGSTDGSKEIARELGASVIDVPIRGYGAALMGAIKAAKGKYIIMADSDNSYDLTNLMPFVEKLRQGYDLVMGNRFLGGIKEGAMPFLNRYIGNPILSNLGKLFFKTNISDFHCGIRGFSKEAVMKMDLQTTGMEFASEMVVKASLLKMRACEVPTTLSPDGRGRPPHLRRWRDGWRHLRFMLLYSPRWLFFYPGIFLMISGVLISLWLLPSPRQVGKMVFDIHTLLYGAFAILVGYQILLFAIYTKIFAIAEGLLPQDEKLNKIFKYINLEIGIVAGTVLSVAGIAGSVYSVWFWQRSGFGPLNPSEMLRMIIPSIIALMLGIQTIFSSFFLSVLGMKRK